MVLALAVAVSLPSRAHAAEPAADDVDARAEALLAAGKYLEAADVWMQALRSVPEGEGNRGQRNSWANGAVYAHKSEFERSSKCPVIVDGLNLADQYLRGLVREYGNQATRHDDYTGMADLRGELDQARADRGCPPLPDRAVSVPEPPRSEPAATNVGERPAARAGTSDAPARSGSARGLAVGVGVSAALTVGMTIGSVVTFVKLRKPDGDAYEKVYDAAVASMVKHDKDTDICNAGKGVADVDSACADWARMKKAYVATTVLAGVFAVSTAVFAGLLIKHRRQSARGVAFMRRHQFQLGAAPQRGGATIAAGLRF